MHNVLSEEIEIAYVFRNSDGDFLKLDFGEPTFSGVPVIYHSYQMKEVTKTIKDKKIKCKKFKVEIINTIKLVGGMENEEGQRLKLL